MSGQPRCDHGVWLGDHCSQCAERGVRLLEQPVLLNVRKIEPLLCEKCGEPVFNIPRMGIWHEC